MSDKAVSQTGPVKDPVSPYETQPDRAFWRTGVTEAGVFPPHDIYQPKFQISRTDRIFTAGSCFAQHIGRVLRENGFCVVDGEPLPFNVPQDIAQRFGYGLYSGRYGNIYTAAQFRQLVSEALGEIDPANPVWERDGRFFDAQRPNVEPDGLATPDLVRLARDEHLERLAETLARVDLVIFTAGLTEAWTHRDSGTVYPTAPGTIAGRHDPDTYAFRNFRVREIRADLEAVRTKLKKLNPSLRVLFTVSPVPLTATATDNHVLTATIHSKSVLRATVGEMAVDHPDVDYFPSYEIISSHVAPARFFEANLRTVSPRGVRRVMKRFLAAHDAVQELAPKPASDPPQETTIDIDGGDAVVCEDELLEAFRK